MVITISYRDAAPALMRELLLHELGRLERRICLALLDCSFAAGRAVAAVPSDAWLGRLLLANKGNISRALKSLVDCRVIHAVGEAGWAFRFPIAAWRCRRDADAPEILEQLLLLPPAPDLADALRDTWVSDHPSISATPIPNERIHRENDIRAQRPPTSAGVVESTTRAGQSCESRMTTPALLPVVSPVSQPPRRHAAKEICEEFARLLGPAEPAIMESNPRAFRDGGKWFNRIRRHPADCERVLRHLLDLQKRGQINLHPAQAAEHFWKEFQCGPASSAAHFPPPSVPLARNLPL